MSRVPLNPAARPVDMFAPQEVRSDIGKADQLMQLASALKSLVPEMAQFSQNYVQMKNIQGMAQAKSDMIKMKIKNQSDLNAAVSSGQIKPEDNPWRYTYLNQLAAREGFRAYIGEMTDQYKKDVSLNQQEDMGAVESWVESGFAKYAEKMSPSEIEAVYPMMDKFKTEFLNLHKEARDKRRGEKIRSGLLNEFTSATDTTGWRDLIVNAYGNGVTAEEIKQIMYLATVERNSDDFGGAGDMDEIVKSLEEAMRDAVAAIGKPIFDEEIVDGKPTGNKVTKLERDQLQDAISKRFLENESLTQRMADTDRREAMRRADERLGKIVQSGGDVSEARVAVSDLPVTEQANYLAAFISVKNKEGDAAAEAAFGPVIAKLARGERPTNDDNVSALAAYAAKESDPDKLYAFMQRLKAAQQFADGDDNSPIFTGAYSDMVKKDQVGWRNESEAYSSLIKLWHDGSISTNQFDKLMNVTGRLYNNRGISAVTMTAMRKEAVGIMEKAFTESKYFETKQIWDGSKFITVNTDETNLRINLMDSDYAVATDKFLEENPSATSEQYQKWVSDWTTNYIKSKNAIPPGENKAGQAVKAMEAWQAGVSDPETNVFSTSSENMYSIDDDGTVRAMVNGQMVVISDPVIASSMEDYTERRDAIRRSFQITGTSEQDRKKEAMLLLQASRSFSKADIPAVREMYLSLVQSPKEYVRMKAIRENIAVEIMKSQRELDAWTKITKAVEKPSLYWNPEEPGNRIVVFNPKTNQSTVIDYWKPSSDGKGLHDWIKEQRKIGNEVYYSDSKRMTLDGKSFRQTTAVARMNLVKFPSSEDLERRRSDLDKMRKRYDALNNNRRDPELEGQLTVIQEQK